MVRRLIFHPEIPDDLTDALAYYDEISSALGDRFREHIKQRLTIISERPESFPTDIAPIRFARVERFPYLIFFVPRSGYVLITAIVYGGSEPKKWRERTDP